MRAIVLAILVLIILSGCASPDRILPDKCTAAPPFTCTNHVVTATPDQNVQLFLQNNAGKDLFDVSVQLLCEGVFNEVSPGKLEGMNGQQRVAVLPNSQQVNVTFTCPAPISGNRWKGAFNITYRDDTGAHVVRGAIQARADYDYRREQQKKNIFALVFLGLLFLIPLLVLVLLANAIVKWKRKKGFLNPKLKITFITLTILCVTYVFLYVFWVTP